MLVFFEALFQVFGAADVMLSVFKLENVDVLHSTEVYAKQPTSLCELEKVAFRYLKGIAQIRAELPTSPSGFAGRDAGHPSSLRYEGASTSMKAPRRSSLLLGAPRGTPLVYVKHGKCGLPRRYKEGPHFALRIGESCM